ncbi:hypothetical protein RSJ3_3749 (plasmid) [Clostridium botulinum]|nr:hypothetical protein RSJ3_3749 [Clostridium botulinum]
MYSNLVELINNIELCFILIGEKITFQNKI